MADELRLVLQFAGFLVGPHLGLFQQFDTESVHEWSELGIIFLMFGLGLEFSFKKLLKIGSSAPDASFCFSENDTVWIAGGKENVDWYK